MVGHVRKVPYVGVLDQFSTPASSPADGLLLLWTLSRLAYVLRLLLLLLLAGLVRRGGGVPSMSDSLKSNTASFLFIDLHLMTWASTVTSHDLQPLQSIC